MSQADLKLMNKQTLPKATHGCLQITISCAAFSSIICFKTPMPHKKKRNALKNIKLLHSTGQFSPSRHGNPQGIAHTRPWEAPGGSALNPRHDGKEKSSAFVQQLGRNPPGEPKAVEKPTPGAEQHLGTHCPLRHLLQEIPVKCKSTNRVLNNSLKKK